MQWGIKILIRRHLFNLAKGFDPLQEEKVFRTLAVKFAFVCKLSSKDCGLKILDKGLIIFRNATVAT